jgi:general secretion pathway protein D
MTQPHTRRRKLIAIFVALSLLTGCAQQIIRNEATSNLRQGNFEVAIKGLQDGVAEYPESTTLRAGLVAARSEAVARLVAEISQFRVQGQFDDADKSVQRALTLEPENARLLGLQTDLRLARHLRLRLDEVATLLADGKKEQALRIVETSLREAPRQPDLLAMQRRLEIELRLDSGTKSQRSLTESRPISLDFRNAPLLTVLEAITRGSGINFIMDRDVRQDSRVTVFLRGARVEDAIELVTGAHQLARRTIDGQTILIYPNTPEKQREHQEQVIRVFHLANAEAKSTAAFLRGMLRLKDVFVDDKANLISIRETPDIVALAERLVALHDVGDAEVMLDVEILEIKTTRLTELGVNFPNGFSLTPLPQVGAAALTASGLRSLNSDRVGVSVAGLLVNLRREVGDFNILANPRIRAKSREKAHILIGDKVPVITSTTNATGFVAETVNYLDVGLKLDVEPVVSPDDDVTIKLALEVSTLAREVRTAAGSLAYQIGTRNATTTLRLRDGETQLLAGLISNEDRSTSNRIPGLGDLPIAGRLFASQKDDFQRTELVLAITPRILRSASRPDLAQAELWIGTELATRLRASPWQKVSAIEAGKSPVANTAMAVGIPAGAPAMGLPAGMPALGGAAVVPSASATSADRVAAPNLITGPTRASFQAPLEVKVGEAFTVNLQLASATPLRGAPLEIAFSPQMFDVLEVAEGDFFKQEGGVTSFTHSINVNTGRIGVGVLRNDATGAIGQATAVVLRLKAKAPGPAEVGLSSLKPISTGEPVPLADLPVLKLTVK